MRYPFVLGFQLQSFWFRCATRAVSESMLIARHPTHRRDTDGGVPPKPIAEGPDLKDHYGDRAHDVDVERI